MRVLYLMGKVPLPVNSGDAHRNLALLRSASTVANQLDLITLPQPDGSAAAAGLAQLDALCDSVTVVGRPVGSYLGSPTARIRTVAGRPYYHSVGSAADVLGAVRRALSRTSYDVIVLSQLYLGSAVPDEYLARTVYDAHNVHHLRMAESLATMRALPPALRRRMIRKVHDQEAELLRRAATSIACSETDAAAFRRMSPNAHIEVIANGIDVGCPARRGEARGRPLFLASLDANANIDSLRYLVDEVLPHLPQYIRIDVAGSNARPCVPRILARGGDRVRFLGEVADARSVMGESAALLVPLLAGGGTRLKVLEAFAAGLPVVSTSKGVEGIPVEHGTHALVADAPPAFADAIVSLVRDPAVGERLAANARRLVEDRYDWTTLAARFADVLIGVAA